MLRRLAIALAALIVVAAGGLFATLRYYAGASGDPAFFEDAIVAFETADRESPPAPGAIVFVGSSSIRLWDGLEQGMAPLPVLERGFGGAHLEHVIHNLERIVLPYAPRAVVVYAGDNDLAAGTGKSVDRVVADFEILVSRLRAERPRLPIYFITIKPSRLRFDRWPDMQSANERIAALAESDPALTILDVATPMLGGGDAEPDSALFALDGLHLSKRGYALWADVIRPRLLADFGEPRDRGAPDAAGAREAAQP